MIRSFRDRATRRLFAREQAHHWSSDLQRTALRKLRMLDAAVRLEDLAAVPGNRLEKLAGRRTGQWSLRINAQWRLCFAWREGDAFDVEIVDYH